MVKICENCGASLDVNAKVCPECGSSLDEKEKQEEMMNYFYGSKEDPEEPSRKGKALDVKGTRYEPVSTLGYIGIILLLCIPIVGLVFAVKWALGGCRKVSKRNFARASLVMMGIGFVMSIVIAIAAKSAITTALEEVGIYPEDITSLYDLFSMLDLSSLYDDYGYDDYEYEDYEDYGYDDYEYDEYGEDYSSEEDYGSEEDAGSSGKSELQQQLAGLTGNADLSEADLQNIQGLQEAMNYLGYGTGTDDYSDSYSEAYTGDSSGEPSESYAQESQEASSDSYEEDSSEAVTEGEWPSGLRKYTHGTLSDMYENYIEFSQTNRQEMMSYVDGLKSDGFKFLDFYGYEMTEQEMLEIDEWCATNGRMFVNVYHYDDIVVIEYMTEAP